MCRQLAPFDEYPVFVTFSLITGGCWREASSIDVDQDFKKVFEPFVGDGVSLVG